MGCVHRLRAQMSTEPRNVVRSRPCDTLNLKKRILGQTRNFNGGPCRCMSAKEFGIDSVHGREIVHRLQEQLVRREPSTTRYFTNEGRRITHRSFDDLPERTPPILHNCLEILQGLFGLRPHSSPDYF
jgi:hypothetical protein